VAQGVSEKVAQGVSERRRQSDALSLQDRHKKIPFLAAPEAMFEKEQVYSIDTLGRCISYKNR